MTVFSEWLAGGRRILLEPISESFTINQLILAFWRHAEQHYRHEDGTPTNERKALKYDRQAADMYRVPHAVWRVRNDTLRLLKRYNGCTLCQVRAVQESHCNDPVLTDLKEIELLASKRCKRLSSAAHVQSHPPHDFFHTISRLPPCG